jgi:hypothetical protein
MLKELQESIIPKRATLLVSKHESPNQHSQYQPRYVFNAETLAPSKFGYKEFSANCALMLAKYMGCSKIKLLCFDACTVGSIEAVDDKKVYIDPNRGALLRQCSRMHELIDREKLEVEWVTPN